LDARRHGKRKRKTGWEYTVPTGPEVEKKAVKKKERKTTEIKKKSWGTGGSHHGSGAEKKSEGK